MYLYVFKVKRNESYDDKVIITTDQAPESVLEKNHLNRAFIAKALTDTKLSSYTVQQVCDAELIICMPETQVIDLS